MQRQFRSQSSRRYLDQLGFSSPRILIGLLLGMTGASLALWAANPFVRGDPRPKNCSYTEIPTDTAPSSYAMSTSISGAVFRLA
ncbi:MAG: hypothetical protein ACJ8LL_03110 [Candidatus Udaeobacter sp.]